MATSLVDSTYTYEGTDADEWFTEAIFGNTTGALCRKLTNVKDSTNVPGISVNRTLSAATCAFTADHDVTIATRKLTVAPVEINKELCEKDFNVLMLSEKMEAGSNNERWESDDFSRLWIEVERKNAKKELEEMYWNGDTAGGAGTHLDYIDGFKKQFLADGAIVKSTGAAITAANILAQLGLLVGSIPKAMRSMKNEEFVGIGMSPGDHDLYIEALNSTSGFAPHDGAEPRGMKFNGYKIFVVNGLADSDLVFCNFKNLWIGCDLEEDENEIEVLPMKKVTGDKTIRMVGNMKVGVSYGVSAEIVFRSPDVPA